MGGGGRAAGLQAGGGRGGLRGPEAEPADQQPRPGAAEAGRDRRGHPGQRPHPGEAGGGVARDARRCQVSFGHLKYLRYLQ